MTNHTVVIEAGKEEGIALALGCAERELGLNTKSNPDVIVMEFGLLSVEDARRINELASQAPLTGGKKVLIIAASRAYHEAQNSLLKLFEEPPEGTYLYLIVPSLGMLLPTLRSRVQILLQPHERHPMSFILAGAEEFIKADREKRSAIAKKLASGRDEDERRENRDKALEILSGIEAAAYSAGISKLGIKDLLKDTIVLRNYLHERSAPIRMIMEHLAIVTPRNLV